jgi:tetraacyldisaccharide 4'-kinase
MKDSVQHWLETCWYQQTKPPVWLRALSVVFKNIAHYRRLLYRSGILKQTRLPVPVIIVGNLSVGGTGKSPLVVYLAECLSNAGYNPGIISRGYGGKATQWPQRVFATSNPEYVGDEAVMIASRSNCPVAVGPVRSQAAQRLLAESGCNVIISDDGLQHYALHRDIEMVVIDGERRFGNGYCLPAGPLREPVERLHSVDFIVTNGSALGENEFTLRVQATHAINLSTGAKKALHEFSATPVHALAGIGNPQRFFNLLAASGISTTRHVFPDHYHYHAADLQVDDDLPLLMTEKDAVKCRAFCSPQHWYVPVNAELEPRFDQSLLHLLQEKTHGS